MMKGLKIYFLIMIIGLIVPVVWNSVPFIKTAVHFVLNPTFGSLLNWNILWGMIIIVFIITLLTTILQKYATDQEALKSMKQEQKALQEEMKKHKDNPEKFMELQKRSMEFIPKTMDLTMKPLLFTAIPFILFFRWFYDYFTPINYKFFDHITWFWFYVIASIVFSIILRKVLKVH
jgi:uncharacterized membrane protein (DUF106 family)